VTWLLLVAQRIGGWLSGLKFWQIVCLGLALFAGLQTIRVSAEKRHSAKVEAQLQKAVAELQRISAKKNEQKVITTERIKVVKDQIRHADERAKIIEQAPLPGQCRTPPEILSADL
jgi:hypothetical protein